MLRAACPAELHILGELFPCWGLISTMDGTPLQYLLCLSFFPGLF